MYVCNLINVHKTNKCIAMILKTFLIFGIFIVFFKISSAASGTVLNKVISTSEKEYETCWWLYVGVFKSFSAVTKMIKCCVA